MINLKKGLVLKILTFVTCLFLHWAAIADEPAGCLIASGKKVRIDTKCKCLDTKSCLSPKKFAAGKAFFEATDAKNKKLFSEKEKQAYTESFKLVNIIMELNSQGKGNSEEIRKHYIALDKINSEISIMLFKNHPETMKVIGKSYKEQSALRKEKRLRMEERALLFVSNKSSTALSKLPVGSSLTTAATTTGSGTSTNSLLKPHEKGAVMNSASMIKRVDEMSDDEKSFILKNIHEKDNKIQENDSLFDIISKTYKARAYRWLLTPKEIQERQKQ